MTLTKGAPWGSGPLVSVVMNAHNSSEFLREAIGSVIVQTYTNWEIVLWDNASTDNSREIASSFEDERIDYRATSEKVSLYESRMAAVAECRGSLIAFLDCDDTWFPEKLQRQMEVFADGDCVVSCTDFMISRETRGNGRVRQSTSRFRTYRESQKGVLRVLKDYRLGMSSIMVRTSAAKAAWSGKPPPFFMIEDLDMVGRIMTQGTLRPVTEVLMTYRRHGNNYSARQDPFAQEWDVWLDRLGSYEVTDNERQALFEFGLEQRARARYRANLLAGNRSAAWQQMSAVPWSVNRLKMIGALALPTRAAWRLVA